MLSHLTSMIVTWAQFMKFLSLSLIDRCSKREQPRIEAKSKRSLFQWQSILLIESYILYRPREVSSTLNRRLWLINLSHLNWLTALSNSPEKQESSLTVSWFCILAELNCHMRLSNQSLTLKTLWKSSKKICVTSKIWAPSIYQITISDLSSWEISSRLPRLIFNTTTSE